MIAGPIGRPSSGYVPGLDGIRAFAVFAVIFSHAGVPFTSGGKTGVLVFFVLSGYLITSILLREREKTNSVDFKRFYIHRALRLGPALVTATATYVLAALVFQQGTAVGGDTLTATPAALFYFLNWWEIAGQGVGFYGHYWSLSVEEQFYVVWPIVVVGAFKVWRERGVLATALVGVVASFTLKEVIVSNSVRQTGTDFAADALLVGCALAAAARLRPALGTDWPRWLGWLATVTLILALALGRTSSNASIEASIIFARIWWPLAILASAILIMLAVGDKLPRPLGWILSTKPIVYLGRISYGMYLWHVLFLWIFEELVGLHGLVKTLLAVVSTVIFCAASFEFFEKRFLLLKRGGRAGLEVSRG